ncbi:phosphoglycerate mutase family protein [Lasiosphaeris hirsuta]|uniref:Phosphoglycerate mutase family protein n=1 Tax=Lasiosphaeris hirsuta TaxID=260670 RepID=A0AA39ZW09_9PEZI|nr:phosphoglycerate mutase family protein [Lasiosphaeris hirsuta]
MPSTIYLIRHAESAHNVTKDFTLRDPGLTPLGHTQAAALATTFPALDTVAVILASPLTRTIETALAAFGGLLADPEDVRVILDPNLQERSDLPCDTGSAPADLSARFPALDFGDLGDEWYRKEGVYTADDAAVAARAAAVRGILCELAGALGDAEGRRDVAVVTHGVFMKFLAGDQGIDLPKAGWKAFTVRQGDGGAVLVPVE